MTPLGSGSEPPRPSALAWFAPVGAALGIVEAVIWRAGRSCLGAGPGAAGGVLGDLALTGALHLDGLADSADGLLAHVPARGRLEIMGEPQIGTFGAVAIGAALLGRQAALAELEPSPALLAALYGSSRAVMALAVQMLPYAREEGLVSGFRHAGPPDRRLLAATVSGLGACLVAARLLEGRRGALATAGGAAAGTAVLAVAQRRLGGVTGDVLGAAGEVCEIAGLLLACACGEGSRF